MSLRPILFGILTNILLGFLAYSINVFAQIFQHNLAIVWSGSVTLALLSALILHGFIWMWSSVRTKSMFLNVVPLFLSSCVDVIVLIDLMMPESILIPMYINANDLLLHSVASTNYGILGGTFMYLNNLLILFRLHNGQNVRTLLLLPSAFYIYFSTNYYICAFFSEQSWHPITVTFLPNALVFFGIIYRILKTSRGFNWSDKKVPGTYFDIIRVPLILISVVIFIYKALAASGLTESGLVEFIRLNDPALFLKDVENTPSFTAVMTFMNVFLVVPLLIICLLHRLKQTKIPFYLWDVSVINFAFILTSQFVFMSVPLYWKSPSNVRLVGTVNIGFWMINLIPVAAAVVQIMSILPYRICAEPEIANQNKNK